MAKNINFISETELPEATGEEVSVLCLENGEMKQKYSASFGGGAETPDMVLTVSDTVGAKVTSSNATVTFGSVSAVFDAARAGRQPIVKIQYRHGADDYAYSSRGETNAVVSLYGESVYLYFCIASSSNILSHTVQVMSDGSISWAESKLITGTIIS